MRTRLAICFLTIVAASVAGAYPLDGLEYSGIRRLEGYQLVQSAPGGAKLWTGQLLSADDIRLGLTTYEGPDFDALPDENAGDVRDGA